MYGERGWQSCEICGELLGYLYHSFTCESCKKDDTTGRLDSNGLCFVCGLPDGGCNCAPQSEELKA